MLTQNPEGKYEYTAIAKVAEQGTQSQVTKADYLKLMEHLITENYIWNGGALLKQVVGIPMGSPVSPLMANLYRYVVEAEYTEDLIKKGDLPRAKSLEFTFGYIDDLLTFGGQLPTEEHYGIPMVSDQAPKDEVIFIGMKIKATNPSRPPRLSVAEKQEEWNFRIIKYPDASSNVPTNQGAAVFKGQVIRYAVICNNLWDFQVAVLKLAQRLLNRGHKARTLIATWNKYLEERWPERVQHKYRLRAWLQQALKRIETRNPEEATKNQRAPHRTWVQRPKQKGGEGTTAAVREEEEEHKGEGEARKDNQSTREQKEKNPEDRRSSETKERSMQDAVQEATHQKPSTQGTGYKESYEEINVDEEESKNEAQEKEERDPLEVLLQQLTPQSSQSEREKKREKEKEEHEAEDREERKPKCEKCDGDHTTEGCPYYARPREEHPDAWANLGHQTSENEEDRTLSEGVKVIGQEGDGDCLFHALAHIARSNGIHCGEGCELRQELANEVGRQDEKGDLLAQWAMEMEGMNKEEYKQRMQKGMYGGSWEIKVFAEKYGIGIEVYTKHKGKYQLIFQANEEQTKKGKLLFTGQGELAHYDVLECEEEHQVEGSTATEEASIEKQDPGERRQSKEQRRGKGEAELREHPTFEEEDEESNWSLETEAEQANQTPQECTGTPRLWDQEEPKKQAANKAPKAKVTKYYTRKHRKPDTGQCGICLKWHERKKIFSAMHMWTVCPFKLHQIDCRRSKKKMVDKGYQVPMQCQDRNGEQRKESGSPTNKPKTPTSTTKKDRREPNWEGEEATSHGSDEGRLPLHNSNCGPRATEVDNRELREYYMACRIPDTMAQKVA